MSLSLGSPYGLVMECIPSVDRHELAEPPIGFVPYFVEGWSAVKLSCLA